MNKIMPHYNQYFKIFLTTIVVFCISLCLISKITFAEENGINIPAGLEAEVGADYRQASDKDATFNRERLVEYERIKGDTSHPIGEFNAAHATASRVIDDYHTQLLLNAKEFSNITDLTDEQKEQVRMDRKALFKELIDKQENFAKNYISKSDLVFLEFINLKEARDSSTAQKKKLFAQQVDSDIGKDLQRKFKPDLNRVVSNLVQKHNHTVADYHKDDQIFKATFAAFDTVTATAHSLSQ